MLDRPGRSVLFVFGAVGLGLYAVGLLLAAHYTLWAPGAPTPDLMPRWLTDTTVALNGLLAAHLASFLGVAVLVGSVRTADSLTRFQGFACIFYAVAVLAAFVVWGLAGFTDDQALIVEVIPTICRTGLGIFIALFGAALVAENQSLRKQLGLPDPT